MIEEPYIKSSLFYTPHLNGLYKNITYHLKWVDEQGNNHKAKINKKIADMWDGYSFFYRICNEEILILK